MTDLYSFLRSAKGYSVSDAQEISNLVASNSDLPDWSEQDVQQFFERYTFRIPFTRIVISEADLI